LRQSKIGNGKGSNDIAALAAGLALSTQGRNALELVSKITGRAGTASLRG